MSALVFKDVLAACDELRTLGLGPPYEATLTADYYIELVKEIAWATARPIILRKPWPVIRLGQAWVQVGDDNCVTAYWPNWPDEKHPKPRISIPI